MLAGDIKKWSVFDWWQFETEWKVIPSDYSDRRPHHHWLPLEVLIKSIQLTSADDGCSVGGILFEMITGGPLIVSSPETSTSVLVSIGQFIGDAVDQILTSLKASVSHSRLFRQTKRWKAVESPFTPLLPLEFRFLGCLFKVIFQWNPGERISINTGFQHPFCRHMHPYYESHLVRLPEIERIHICKTIITIMIIFVWWGFDRLAFVRFELRRLWTVTLCQLHPYQDSLDSKNWVPAKELE
jgi:serine/threonine protein kinase